MVQLRLSVAIAPETLYQFEVLRLRLEQTRSEAVREALQLAMLRMVARADRYRRQDLRDLERKMDDDPLIECYLQEGHAAALESDPAAP